MLAIFYQRPGVRSTFRFLDRVPEGGSYQMAKRARNCNRGVTSDSGDITALPKPGGNEGALEQLMPLVFRRCGAGAATCVTSVPA